MVKDRIGLIVWARSLKKVKSLRSYGHIHFISRNMKYVVLYCDQETCEETIKRLRSLPFVKYVQKSQRPFLVTDYLGSKWSLTKSPS